VVQSKRWVDCHYDGDKEVIHLDGSLYTLDEWREANPEMTPTEGHDTWHEHGPFEVRVEWEDKEVFLTEKAAMLYMHTNAHHLNEPRTYVKHFWRNSQMETVMRALEEFSGEKLIWR
jgi:hypothetical protein